MNLRDSILQAQTGGPQQNPDGSVTFEFRFRPEDPTFAGHFPGRPILPGVFQLEMARLAAEQVLPGPLAVREIRKAKFQRPILPDETVRVELKCDDLNGTIQAHAVFSVLGQAAGVTTLCLTRGE